MIKAIQVAARIIPETRKIRLVLERLIEYGKNAYFSHLDAAPVEVQEEDDCFLLVYKSHFESDMVTSFAPVCFVRVGAIQTLVEWITGHPHEVEEIQCRAMGDPADVFKISKSRKKD